MGLLHRLESLDATSGRITDSRFEKLKKAGTNMGKDGLITMQRQLNKLADIIEKKLIPDLEENAEFDAEFEFEDRGTGNYD